MLEVFGCVKHGHLCMEERSECCEAYHILPDLSVPVFLGIGNLLVIVNYFHR
jgi:hypothetical protein